MNNIQQKSIITVRPVPVKEYVTQEGAIRTAHMTRHKVAEPSQKPTIHSKSTTPLDIDTTIADTAYSIYGGKNSSRVARIQSEDGNAQWFKSKSGEAWRHKDRNGNIKPIRLGIENDRLGDKECLAYDLASEFGLTNIPKTYKTKVTLRNKTDIGIGSVQQDATQHLNKTGSTHEVYNLIEWLDKVPSITERVEGGKGDSTLGRLGSETYDSMVDDALKNRTDEINAFMRSTLRNGGMDMSYFDYIIGNLDRHGANLLVGKNNTTGAYIPVGIDNGLSFPNSEKFNKNDIKNTLAVEWKMATAFGKDIECSKTFTDKIMSKDLDQKLQKHMDRRGLVESEQKGVKARLATIRNEFKKNGKLDGTLLKGIIDKSII